MTTGRLRSLEMGGGLLVAVNIRGWLSIGPRGVFRAGGARLFQASLR
jgi:hypothetical protein